MSNRQVIGSSLLLGSECEANHKLYESENNVGQRFAKEPLKTGEA